MDKISQLPDDILLRFLPFLDFKNAVQTSILAKRWRYLWTWLTDLDLDSLNLSIENFRWWFDEEIGPQRYLNWVDKVIDAHRSPCITKFRVFHDSGWTKDVSHVTKWVRFALSKRVEELDLRLRRSGCSPKFSLGIDILNHMNGITNLRSLRMSSVDISGEFLEIILFHCHLLEQLHVDNSDTLHTLNIVSDRLKQLTLVDCRNLKELQIDALNLFSFHFEDDYQCVRTHMVFKSVPTLVEVGLTGESCLHPCPILEQISCLSNQLTKLSFGPTFDFGKFREYVGTPMNLRIDVLFPNVKQLTLSVMFCSLLFIESFINGCPMLHELKLQIEVDSTSTEEATQLQNIELNEERNEVMPREQNPNSESQIDNLENWKAQFEDFPLQSRPNLKVLELVGFRGCSGAVICSMSVIACANSFETLICDPRSASAIGTPWEYEIIEDIYTITNRVRKLAKLLPSNIRVGVRGESGLVWV